MRFLRQSLIGLVLAALSLGLLAYAGSIVGGAVQDRLAQESKAPPARERVFAVGVITAEPGTETPTLQAFGEVESRRTLELRAAVAGRALKSGSAGLLSLPATNPRYVVDHPEIAAVQPETPINTPLNPIPALTVAPTSGRSSSSSLLILVIRAQLNRIALEIRWPTAETAPKSDRSMPG